MTIIRIIIIIIIVWSTQDLLCPHRVLIIDVRHTCRRSVSNACSVNIYIHVKSNESNNALFEYLPRCFLEESASG